MRIGLPAIAASIAAALAVMACSFDELQSTDEPPPNAEPQAGCALGCHGTETSNAPPVSTKGATETTAVAVGAHQEHLAVASNWHRQVACADCHVLPSSVDSPGHIDGDGKAEVTFSMIAGPNATWNGTTCTTTCHGSVAMGGAQTVPNWTRVDGSQVTCGSCHGRPPPAPHPAVAKCATCHPTLEEDNVTFRDPGRHIDGKVDSVDPAATGGCTTCHGSTTSAPPKDLAGHTERTERGVGAHAAHLTTSTWRRTIACSECHAVPDTVNTAGHLDATPGAEVRFNALNQGGAYAAGSCTNLYCHSNGRGTEIAVSWTTIGALACTSCHSLDGTGMSGRHKTHIDQGLKCAQCHGGVIDANNTIKRASDHVNGRHEVQLIQGNYIPLLRRCSGMGNGCHGTKNW